MNKKFFTIIASFILLAGGLLFPFFSVSAQTTPPVSSKTTCYGGWEYNAAGLHDIGKNCPTGEYCYGSKYKPTKWGFTKAFVNPWSDFNSMYKSDTRPYNEKFNPGACYNPADYQKQYELDTDKLDCGMTNLPGCFKYGAAWAVSVWLYLLSRLLSWVGYFFDQALIYTILNFKTFADMDGINMAWTLGRDFANICFIFVLLFVALNQVLDIGWFETKKVVVRVILVALLINFSAILPKVIIDSSNILANTFYQQMSKNNKGDIGGAIVSSANPNSLLAQDSGVLAVSSSNPNSSNLQGAAVTWSTIICVGLGTSILIVIIGYVLIILSFMLFSRMIVLLFLIALSSLAVFALVLPKTKHYFNTWFDTLIEEAFFAPAVMFTLYIVINTINSKSFTDLTRGTQNGYMAKIVGYVLVIGMTIASIFVAKKLSKVSRNVGNQIKDKVSEYGGNIGKYGGGAAASYTVGRAAQRFADSDMAKNMAARSPRLGAIARSGAAAVGGAKFGSTASFKEREEARAKSLAGKMEGMNDTQRTQFTQNIKPKWFGSSAYDWARGGSSQELLYKKGMSEDERTRLEKENQYSRSEIAAMEKRRKGEGLSEDEQIRRGLNLSEKESEAADKYETKEKAQKTLEDLRKILPGKEQGQALIERFKAMKSEDEQLSQLASLEEKDQARVMENLSESAVAKMRIRVNNLSTSTDAEEQKLGAKYKGIMEASSKEFDLERQNKIGDLEGKAADKQAVAGIKTQLGELGTYRAAGKTAEIASTSAAIRTALQNRKQGTLNSLGTDHIEELIKDPALLSELGQTGVIELERNKSLTEDQRQRYREAIEQGATAATGVDPDTQAKLQKIAQWMSNPDTLDKLLFGKS